MEGQLATAIASFSKGSRPKFEIVILFRIVQRSDNKSSAIDTTPLSPGASIVSYASGPYNVSKEGVVVSS